MVLLMLDAGLRVGELCALKVHDLYFGDHAMSTLVLRPEITKTKQERCIPLTDRIIEAIEQMHRMAYYWHQPNPDTPAFCGYSQSFPLRTRTVEMIITQASKNAFGRAITPHTLRHTFATRLMQRTNIRVVQQLLGHKSIQSTQIYTHPNHDDLTNAIKSLS